MLDIRARHAHASIAPEACGGVTRFSWSLPGSDRIDWLRPASEEAVAAANPQGMSCFPLVPFSNRIRDGRFEFQGREIDLPPNFLPEPHTIHGHGWRAVWDVVERHDDRVAIEYTHEPDAWPFPYRARQTFTITPDDLTLEMSVKNLGDEPMPLGFGFHPYFVRTEGARLETAADAMWEADSNAMPSELVEPPTLDGLDPNAVVLDNNFIGWSGSARIRWPEWNASLDMTTEGPFECFIIYTPKGEDYFCAEPATNCIDAFNLAREGRDDTGMMVLGGGEESKGRVRLRPSLAS